MENIPGINIVSEAGGRSLRQDGQSRGDPSIRWRYCDVRRTTLGFPEWLSLTYFVSETKEVPEHSEDARKWPRIDSETPTDPSGRVPERTASPTIPIDSATATLPPNSPLPSPEFIPPPQVSTPAKRVARKPRQSLASLAAASVAKPHKLTTLQKSRLDWESHLASTSQSEVDELERNRKGGGYLEKVDFLQRVDGRKDEAMTSGKRRR